MKTVPRSTVLLGLSAAAFVLCMSTEAAAVDAAAAQALARQSNCFKCHAIDKDKEATSWKTLASKIKGEKDIEAKLVKHLTTGPKVKFLDGHEEEHPVIKSKDPEQIKNVVGWILAM